tara:strand:+ start:13147 stop:13344 length:198 start_codon:yes stop_codon:yes gene_type:complete
MELKNLALVDRSLVEFLKKKYPPIEWDPSDNDNFISDAIYRAGQRDIISKIEHIISLQKKGKVNG